MSGDTTLSIGLICLVISCVITVLNYSRLRKGDIKTESSQTASVSQQIKEDNLKLNMKLDSICQNLNELRQDTRSITNDIKSIENRVTVVEQSLKQAWRYIDDFKGEEK